jgi:hypothetical protein
MMSIQTSSSGVLSYEMARLSRLREISYRRVSNDEPRSLHIGNSAQKQNRCTKR